MSDDAPIPAATLVLVRDRPGGPCELLMVRRARAMTFAGGAMVFPGGRIDPADHRLGGSGEGAARVAAIRETIEEVAIPVGIRPAPGAAATAAMQDRLLAGADFAELLDEAGLSLDPSGLVPLARWVPQFHARRRFDTLFFVARADADAPPPHIVPGECSDAEWVTAAAMLDRDRRGEAQLIFPTRRTLERLALHRDFDSIAADARAYRIAPITPWVEERDGERFVTIPGDIGFPVVRERLDGLWRG